MTASIIFDLDGTLVDSSAVCAAILSDMLRDRGSARVITGSEAMPFLSKGGTAMVSGLLGAACLDATADIAEFRARYAQLTTPRDSLYHGVDEGLRKLFRAGLKLAICSNKPQNLCEKVLSDVGIAHLFTTVMGGGPGRPPKPHTFLLDRTLEQLGSTASNCMFVGDSELDFAIAASTSIPFLFVSYGYAEQGWNRPELVQFGSFLDLVDHILASRQTRRRDRQAA
jgi:phosphoglycolate phosphatase